MTCRTARRVPWTAGGGLFTVAAVDFFAGGYWQLYLDLIPSAGAADPVTFDICVPTD